MGTDSDLGEWFDHAGLLVTIARTEGHFTNRQEQDALCELSRLYNYAFVIHSIEEVFTCLDEMYNCSMYQGWISDRLGNDLFLSDPERADRIHKYAEDGSDGSTHGEVINDWDEFLEDCIDVYDLDEDDPEDLYRSVNNLILKTTYNKVKREIEQCRDWWDKQDKLHEIIN